VTAHPSEKKQSFAITDCGSTTTKAILIELVDGCWRQTYRGDAPTTVEAPNEDVCIGVRDALRDMEQARGQRIMNDQGELLRPRRDGQGVDVYLSTSSAGGGLQMLVMGLVRRISARSAEAAALGAGAIVTDVLAYDDLTSAAQQIERLRQARPDMILLSGGEDGGAVVQVVELAELLAAASVRSRTGGAAATPVVFAGNASAAQAIEEQLGPGFKLHVVPNVRPLVELQELGPAREKIHELFLEHVMQQAPGYAQLSAMVDAPILPTPTAVGNMLLAGAKERSTDIVCVDIGGATTDVFSVCTGRYHRTVSANLGMSYSATNVLVEAGVAGIGRWLPRPMDDESLRNAVMNKTVRPTTIPDTTEDLLLEQALAREAMRLAYDQHKRFATDLAGRTTERGFDSAFQPSREHSFVRPMEVGLIIGSGGVVSHAPRHAQAALMLIDAFEPEGVTAIAKDSIFMLPHLGVLASVCEEAALSVLEQDCLFGLCTCIAPVGPYQPNRPCLHFEVIVDGQVESGSLSWGALRRIELSMDKNATLELTPFPSVDVGNGKGKKWRGKITGGPVGLVLDARGRPLPPASDPESYGRSVRQWLLELGAFTAKELTP
jgi:uncharacterized protein (TIGR01319 family)